MRKHRNWDYRCVCPKCGYHEYLAHSSLTFTDTVCPSCGTKLNDRYTYGWFKVRMKYVPPEYDYYFGFWPTKVSSGRWKVHEDDQEKYDRKLGNDQ